MLWRASGLDRDAGVAAGPLVRRQQLAEPAHVLDRDADGQLQRLARAGVDDADVAALPRPARPDSAQEAGDRLHRALRRREPDPLRRARGQLLQPLQAEGQMGAALGAGQGVDLVDDHVLDAAQDLGRLAGEDQVQRLGRGDEDVRRVADQVAPLVGRRVAGPDADLDLRHRLAQPLGRQADPGQRRPQVALHVVDERLERRDVQDADRARRARGRGRGSRPSRSRHHRNAASVLPLPVGAWIRVWRPAAMLAQPSTWAGVGAAKAERNHSATAGPKGASGSSGPPDSDGGSRGSHEAPSIGGRRN